MRPHSPVADAAPLTLDDVLDVRHPGPPAWSPLGDAIAFLWNDGGLTHLFTVDPEGAAPPRQVSRGEVSVSAFHWSTGGDLVYAQGGRIWLAPREGELRSLTGGGKDSTPRFSPDGHAVAFLREGRLQVLGLAAASVTTWNHPGRVNGGLHAPPFIWSPDGSRIAAALRIGGTWTLGVIDPEAGTVWQYRGEGTVQTYAWVGGDRLHCTVSKNSHSLREHWLVDLGTGRTDLLATEERPLGLKQDPAPQVNRAATHILYSMPVDGWLHLYLLSLADRKLTQITEGPFEDAGHESEIPRFSADGRQIVWSSNRGDLTQRQLWTYELASGEQKQITALVGTNCDPAFSPDGLRVAFIHAGPYGSSDVWVIRADGSGARQLSFSMPPGWTREKIAEPKHVTYPGVGGVTVHADIWLPKGFDPYRRYPAMVFVHGGQTRQMRFGWHPMHSYAVFYSFNQFLLHQGYVVMSVDYRGGTGFGQEFMEASHLGMGVTDAQDVADSARFLADLGYVDPARIGVWGLSYGGYMTLAVLTRFPETFAAGCNIAGLWDYDQWYEYWCTLYQDIHFTQRMGGPRGPETEQYYRDASPRNLAHQIVRPSLHLMGTADERVDFAQMDRIAEDLTKLGKEFELMYYPGETHMFTWRHTWRDAFSRMLAFFGKHLRPGE